MDDKMQEIYPFLAQCDHVLLASPICFSSLSGPLLNVARRVQTYFAGRFFRGEPELLKQKKRCCPAGRCRAGHRAETAGNGPYHYEAYKRWTFVAAICSMPTNKVSAKKDEEALRAARDAAKTRNQLYHKI